MDNPMDLITELMKNPQAVENIKNMLENMGATKPEESADSQVKEQSKSSLSDKPDLSFLNQILSGNKQSTELISNMKKAYDVYANPNEPSVKLLSALTPFLSQKRANNINAIAQIARVGKALNKISKG